MTDPTRLALRTSSEVMLRAIARWQQNLERPAAPTTGIDPLDRLMPGLLAPGSMTVVGARPGIGKTLVGHQLATHVARTRPDLDVLIASLEMTAEAMARRHAIVMAAERGAWLHDPHQWRDERDSPTLMAGLQDFGALPIQWYDSDAALGPVMSVLRAGIAQSRGQGRDVGLVMIDYVQLIRASDSLTRTDEVARASAAIAELAKEEDVAVIALAQLNRGVAGADGSLRRPVLSDLRDSGTIEQDATAVLLLHSEPMRCDGDVHNTEIIIGKARHWPVRQGYVIEMEQAGLRWVPRDEAAPPPPASKLLLPEVAKAPPLYAGRGKYVTAAVAGALPENTYDF